MSDDLSTLPRPDGVYVIYSMDATCSDKQIDNMGPLNRERYWPADAPVADWQLTEDNGEYEYGYLAREGHWLTDTVYLPADEAEAQTVPSEVLSDDDMPSGYGFEYSIDGTDYYMKMDDGPYFEEHWRTVTGEQYWGELEGGGVGEAWEVKVEDINETEVPARPQGRHRKWVALLTFEQWEAFASNYCIDLHDNGMPERYDDTLGSLTEFGHIPAIAVDNTEGWGDNFGDPVIDSSFYCSFFTYPRDYSNDRGALAWDARANEYGVANMLNELVGEPVFEVTQD